MVKISVVLLFVAWALAGGTVEHGAANLQDNAATARPATRMTTVTATTQGVAMEVVAPAQVFSNRPIPLTVTLQNKGNVNVTYWETVGHPGEEFHVEIRDANGSSMDWIRRLPVPFAHYRLVVLPPKDKAVRELWIDRMFKLDAEGHYHVSIGLVILRAGEPGALIEAKDIGIQVVQDTSTSRPTTAPTE